MTTFTSEDGAPVELDLVLYRGATNAKQWLVDEDGAFPTGWPSEWVARAEIREDYGATILCRFHSDDTEADGQLYLDTHPVTSPPTARLVLGLRATASEGMTWESGIWDLELVHEPSGRVIRLFKGAATLDFDVTIGG